MEIEYDPAKRAKTLAERGLDFDDAARIFDGPRITERDDRFEYPEDRFVTYGLLDGRLVAVVWTPIADGIRVISMRKCNERERKKYKI
jgi:hypothetical protein